MTQPLNNVLKSLFATGACPADMKVAYAPSPGAVDTRYRKAVLMVKIHGHPGPTTREFRRGYGKAGQKRENHLHTILVARRAPRHWGEPERGVLTIGSLALPCAIGASGVTHRKREGDKATPAGSVRLLRGYYRPDRASRPRCAIPLRPLVTDLGWCDQPGTPLYNRPATLPIRASHEKLWRSDQLYDVVFVLDYNIAPRRDARGSAIFFHCAKPDLAPTLGCIALRPADMRRLLPRLAAGVRLLVPS